LRGWKLDKPSPGVGSDAKSPTRLEGMETNHSRYIQNQFHLSPTRLEGMETGFRKRLFNTSKKSPTRLEGMETQICAGLLRYGCKSLRPALRGWKRVIKYGKVFRSNVSPTRLEGMETFVTEPFTTSSLSCLRPALRGWKLHKKGA